MKQISWQVFSDGWTEAPEAIALRGGSWFRKVKFHATAFLLQHPDAGWILFDTGYSARFFKATARFPECLYRWVTPVHLTASGGIKQQLEEAGVAATEVRHLFLSHFHADHVGGVQDFPNAQIYCSRQAWDAVRSLSRWAGVRRAFLSGLLPDDFASRLTFVDEGSDLLGDGSFQIVRLPGHAIGQLGLKFQASNGQNVLLAADACWLSQAFRENRPPHQLTRVLHDWPAYLASLQRLHDWHREDPALLILPTHCPETAAHLRSP
jgi:glyoxylase-like metal-dependent hydrolase (beta-lactamase superfamily II)